MIERQSAPHPDQATPRSHLSRYSLLWIAGLAVAIVFVGRDSDRLSAPFGPSHDGFNAALYMTGGRAIVEEGLFASRFGASSRTLSGDRVIYAHHPPLVYLENAVALAAPGPIEIAARLPAVGSSLVVLVLLVLLLAACRLPSGPASVGLLFACATPMFLMFGAMTEPHALGLAPMTALILLWQQTRLGDEPPSWTFTAVAGFATLTSWQAGLCAASVAVVLLLITRRRRAGIAVLAGTMVSAILIGGWILWSYDGNLGEFMHRAVHRVGAGDVGRVTFRQMARQQMRYFADLFPVGSWLVILVAALGILDRRTQPLVAVSLGTVLGYALVFRNGAYDHNYWLYCILLPLTLSAAVVADAVARWLSRPSWPRAAPLMLGSALVAALGITMWQPSKEQDHRRHAADIGVQARALRWPRTQRYAYHMFGGSGLTDLLPWMLFYSQRQPFGVDSPQSVPIGQVLLHLDDGRLVTVVPGKQALEP